MEITLESIKKKLGFDPSNPPKSDSDGWTIDDNKPSIWAPLTEEEKIFVIEKCFGMKWPHPVNKKKEAVGKN